MQQKLELIALHLHGRPGLEELTSRFGHPFKKGIEATYYAEAGETLIAWASFNVLTVIDCSRERIAEVLNTLGVEEAEHLEQTGIWQDYPILIDSEMPSHFTVDNETIALQSRARISLLIIAHVISQSVAMELYEAKLADYTQQSRRLIDTADTPSLFKRGKLAHFAKALALIRHDMMIDLHLLDKPNILWDNEDAEQLYNRLASVLELKDRFDVVEYKLNSIKDDIIMVMDLTNHNHSSFLEWIIIVLITVEIVMGLFGLMG